MKNFKPIEVHKKEDADMIKNIFSKAFSEQDEKEAKKNKRIRSKILKKVMNQYMSDLEKYVKLYNRKVFNFVDFTKKYFDSNKNELNISDSGTITMYIDVEKIV